jgi:hypothetical protein
MIPKKPAPHSVRGGYRFPACAKSVARLCIWLDASAGEAKSEKIMRQQESKSAMTIQREVIAL